MKRIVTVVVVLIVLHVQGFSQDKDFYIFLCFGQSNMEGAAKIEPRDTLVDSRFQVLEAVDCANLGRQKGHWYTAVPPLSRCKTGLTPSAFTNGIGAAAGGRGGACRSGRRVCQHE